MTTFANETNHVQADLINTLGISKRHSERALVSMSKLIKINREVVSLINTSKVIYNNLWVELVNKWSSKGTVEIKFLKGFDPLTTFDVNEDLVINLTDNSISYKSNQFLLGTSNSKDGNFINITGKRKYKEYLATFNCKVIKEVSLVCDDGNKINVTTLITNYIKELM